MSCQKVDFLARMSREDDIATVNFEASSQALSAAPRLARCTYVLWDLDEGEGVLGGLSRQGPDAEGRWDGGQTGGRHNFSLMEDKDTKKNNRLSTGQFQGRPGICVTMRAAICFSLINHTSKQRRVCAMMTTSKQT